MRKPLIVAAALIVLMAFFALQNLRRSAAQKKFPVGTSMQQAMSQLRLPYYVQTNSDDSFGWRYLVMQFGRDQRLISVVSYADHK